LSEIVLEDGYQIQVAKVHRGMLLAHTEEEWLTRYRSFMKVRFILYTIALGGGELFFLVAAYLSGQALLYLCDIILVVIQVMLTQSYYSTLANLEKDRPVPGVYKHGIQMPVFPVYVLPLFIPWADVEDVWVKRSRISEGTLYISIKKSRWRWRYPVVILGEEGVNIAIARARDPIVLPPLEVDETPPRLVIYGADGVRSESLPEEL
jgi:hypothetical protein